MTCGTIQLDTDLAFKGSPQDMKEVSRLVREGSKALRDMGPEAIIELLDDYGKKLQASEMKGVEGVPFLAMWLRKANLERVLAESFGDPNVLKDFVGAGRRKVKAQPRGLACHWIAGNVPTLGLFSLLQSLLVGNANILRVPAGSVDVVRRLLTVMAGSKASKLMASFAVITFPSSDKALNEALSMVADVRVVWGGMEAVEAITGLQKQGHCEDIVFGPKYSFAVIDKKALASKDLNILLRRLAGDIVMFEQGACSSPQVLFFEKGFEPKLLMDMLAKELAAVSKKMPKTEIDTSTATRIINKRAEYALSEERNMKASKDIDWTILFDEQLRLEEPVQSRTLFLKPCKDIMDIIPLITHKIQTVGMEVHDGKLAKKFADAVTLNGVARCVPFGQMNFYESPWDGMIVMGRLVRFCSMNEREE